MDKKTFLDIVSGFNRDDFRRYLYENSHKRKVIFPIELLDEKGKRIEPIISNK